MFHRQLSIANSLQIRTSQIRNFPPILRKFTIFRRISSCHNFPISIANSSQIRNFPQSFIAQASSRSRLGSPASHPSACPPPPSHSLSLPPESPTGTRQKQVQESQAKGRLNRHIEHSKFFDLNWHIKHSRIRKI